jgi:hypothetical protein
MTHVIIFALPLTFFIGVGVFVHNLSKFVVQK